jgi:hypothetical protein
MLAGGDLIGAAPLPSRSSHESTVEILNDIGLDVSSLGNHEFDAGLAELQRVIAAAARKPAPGSRSRAASQRRYRGARFNTSAPTCRRREPLRGRALRDQALQGIPVAIHRRRDARTRRSW